MFSSFPNSAIRPMGQGIPNFAMIRPKPIRFLRTGFTQQTPRALATPPRCNRRPNRHFHAYEPYSPVPIVAAHRTVPPKSSQLHPPLQHNRAYHSYEHTTPPPFTPPETAILSAALLHVPTHGFTQAALMAGARDAGYLSISTNLFPQGPIALINYHLVTSRLALAHLSGPPPQTNPTTPDDIVANIRTLCIARLHANAAIIKHWQSALALLATPAHLPTSIKELALLADEILFLAGSTTVTGAWYTDRAGLAAVYASAELYMTGDQSGGFVETEGFLRRRLEEGEGLRRGLGGVGRWVGGQVGGLVDGLRSKGVRI